MYIGLPPEVCRYMSMKLSEAGHIVVGDASMHKLMMALIGGSCWLNPCELGLMLWSNLGLRLRFGLGPMLRLGVEHWLCFLYLRRLLSREEP
eukprot:jgi/Tetstr1/434201/TSEL_023312.t1